MSRSLALLGYAAFAMREDHFASEETAGGELFTRVAEKLVPGGWVREVRALQGGVSASVHRLDVEGPEGAGLQVVVRRLDRLDGDSDGGSLAREAELLVALRRLSLPVPEVLLYDDSGEGVPSPYLVMELVDATTGVEAGDLRSAMRQMAEFLARLHGLDVEAPSLPPLPDLEDPIEGLSSCLPPGDLGRRLESVVGSLGVSTSARSVLHGDYWPGNVLWKAGRLAAVIDWEDATYGDPLSDVACCRVELLCEHGEEAMQTFTEDYAQLTPTVDLEGLPIWEVYVSAAALSSMARWGLAPEVEARRRARTEWFLERAARELLAGRE